MRRLLTVLFLPQYPFQLMEYVQIHDHILVNHLHDILVYTDGYILFSKDFCRWLFDIIEAKMIDLDLIYSFLNLATKQHKIELIVGEEYEHTLIAIGFERDFSI